MVKRAILSVVCLGLGISGLLGQDVFAVPGVGSTAHDVAAFTVSPFGTIRTFSAGTGTYLVLAKPDGSKFYAIASSATATVSVADTNFANVTSLGDLGHPATAAVITSDGKRLAVAAGILQVYNTATDTPLVAGGVNLGSSNLTVIDVAANLEGTRLFALSTTQAGGTQLNAVDPNNGALLGSALSIGGTATGVAVGTNGLVYVSTLNQILEIDPNSLTVTQGGTISVNGRPGRLVFPVEGKYAVAVNQLPNTGSVALLIDLTTRAVVNTISSSGFGVKLDQLLVTGSNRLVAFSSQNQSLYELTIGQSAGTLSIGGFTVSGVPATAVTGIAVSNEVPAGGRVSAQYLFVLAQGTLYRYDLTTNQLSGQFSAPANVGGVSLAGPATTQGLASTLLQYGNNQTIGASATSAPIVVRVLDGAGNPLSGLTVTFASTAGSVSPATPKTGTDGYAVTYLTAPATTGGSVNVTATAGSHVASYTINIGTASGGGPAGGISILTGQGQLLLENSNTQIPQSGSPLTVLITDANSKPLNGVQVTFTITNGNGTLVHHGDAVATTVPNGLQVNTDPNGKAAVDFLTSLVLNTITGFDPVTITASAQGTPTATFYLNIVPRASSLTPNIQLVKPDPDVVLMGQSGGVAPAALTVQIVSGRGVPIPNVAVVPTNGADPTQFPAVSCVGDPNNTTGVLSDANGLASCDIKFNGKIGSGTFQANVGNFNLLRPINFQIAPGPPSQVQIIQGNNQTGKPGQTLPLALKVTVTDAGGFLLANVPVTWQVTPTGGATLSNVSAATDVNGQASALPKLGTTNGPVQVKVTAAGAISATFTLTVNNPLIIGSITKVSGDAQNALISTAFTAPLIVKVLDNANNLAVGAPVTFAVTGGAATLGTPTPTTDTSGQASTTVTAGATAGPITITATAGSFSTTFSLTARLNGPTNVTFLNGASFQTGISPGSVALISGTGILTGVQGLVVAYTIVGPLPTTLGGASITFGGIPAPIYYVQNVGGKEVVAVQVPFEVTPGAVNVVINGAGGGSATVSTQVQPYSPGIFQTVAGNQTLAVAIRPNGSYIGPDNPARRGEVITFFATGLGQVNPATATGEAGIGGQAPTVSFVVGINNSGVPITAALYQPGNVGVYMLSMLIPADTQAGPAQPLGLIAFDSANNAYYAQSVNIPVQ